MQASTPGRSARSSSRCRPGRPRGRRAGDRCGRARRARSGSRRSQQLLRRDRRVLADLARAVHLHRALARDAAPLGAHAQAADLRADRRHRRRADGRPARADRRRAQLGLPLHLGPRRLVLALRAARPGLHRGGGGVRPLAAATASRERAGGERGPLQIMYRVDGSLRPDRGDPRPLGGLPRLAPGADRQRRRRPAAARHLRRGDRQHLPRRPARHRSSATTAGRRPAARRRLALRATGTSPTRASGRPAAAGRTSPTGG